MSYIPIAGYVAKTPEVVNFTATGDTSVQTVVDHNPEGGIIHVVHVQTRYAEGSADGQEAQFRLIIDGVTGDWIKIKTTGEGLFASQGFAHALREIFSGSGTGTALGDYRNVTLNAFYQASLKIEFQAPTIVSGPPQYRFMVFRSQRVA